jgi:anti-sigma factor RsiW
MNEHDSNTVDHTEMIELLDPYIDGELDATTAARVEGHVRQCERCRRALVLHRALRTQLGADPLPHASEDLHRRVTAIGRTRRESDAQARRAMAAWGGWALAASLLLAWGLQALLLPVRNAPVPMVQAAVVDFGARMDAALPPPDLAALQSSLPFPVTPLPGVERQLLATWRTTIRGEPAAALAYRVSDHVVVQYVVSQHLFFEQPRVREAIAQDGRYRTQDREVSVLAWPHAGSGILLVGRVDPGTLESLRM